MFPVFRSLSLRYLRLRWERAALVVVSIALGVATLVSTRILNQVIEAAAHETMTPIPTADLYVTNGEIGVQRSVADEIKAAKVPGVKAVAPIIFDQIRLTEIGGPEGKVAILVAADLDDASALRGDESKKRPFTPHVMDWKAARSGTGIFISDFLQKERLEKGLKKEGPLHIRYAGNEYVYPLAGTLSVDNEGAAASFERNLVVMDLDLALALIKHQYPPGASLLAGGLVNGIDAAKGERIARIDIHLAKGADRERARAAVQEVVGDRAAVKTLEEQKKSTDDAIGGIQISFSICSAGALIVGLFLVYNALSVSVAERRHDIGILRSLGATRNQVARLFAGEATLLGLTGAILGIPLGIFLADTAIDFVREDLNSMFLNPDVRPTRLSPLTMLTAVVAGVLTALLAALVPAIQASHDEPADAVRRGPSSYTGFFRVVHRLACLLLITAGIGAIVFRGALPERSGGYVGLLLVLVGLFLSMPILVGVISRLLQPLFRWFFGVEARLAADNLLRAPARTGVVIGALAAGVSLMFQTAGVGKSNERPVKEWVERVIQADAFVFSGSLTSANSSLSPMPSGIPAIIKEKVPGVERTVGLRILRPEYRDTVICLVAIDAQDYYEGALKRLDHIPPGMQAFQEMSGRDNVVISDNFAAKFNVKVGDTITLPRRKGGPLDLKVVGVGQDYTWSKGTIFLDRKRYVEEFEDDYIDVLHIYFKPGVDPVATRKAVEEAVAPYKLAVEDRAFVKEYLAGIIDKLYRIAYLQQFIVGVVAALGVVTALLISVLQRRRELGLLRAVGATQVQVLRTVLAEAFLMGAIGTVLGVLIGLPMEWYLLKVVLFEESGFAFDMIIPWKEALGIGLVAVAIATLAGLIPALHAVRLRIVDAIAYE
jgi:putative ABC transport system permease protein